MFSRKVRFLAKTAIASHLKFNVILYLILIGAIITGDHAAAITQLKLIAVRAGSELLNFVKYLNGRRQKMMKRKISDRAQ